MEEKAISILLVEDNPGDVCFFEAALAETDIPSQLEVSTDGLDAWSLLSGYSDKPNRGVEPDVIVLDLNLPGMSGRQILAEVVQRPDLQKIPICIFTGAENEQTIVDEYPPLRLCFEAKTDSSIALQDIIRRIVAFARSAQSLASGRVK